MSEGQHYPLRELADTLAYELALQGVPSSLHLGAFPAPTPRTVFVLLDPEEYWRLEGKRAPRDDAILRRTIFVCAERPSADADDRDLDLLRRAGAVFALDQRSVTAMRRLGIPARLLRPGYSKSLDRFDPEAPRPIDVMFLGDHSLRRTRYLGRAAKVLSRHNCLLQISDGVPSPGDTSSFLGPGRWSLLAQTKILINIHRTEDSRFEWRSALDAIHTGAVVVTEHATGIMPLEPGEHLLVASPDSLPYVVEALLRDERRLARIRQQAYERLSSWIPYALWVSVLRAAVVELVGEPIGVEALPAKPQPDKAPAVASGAPAPATTDAGAAQHSVLVSKPLHIDVARCEIAHETPAWRASPAPRLTAIVVLVDDCEHLGATLYSLAYSRLRDFELVVVDAGESDRGRGSALDWLVDHPRIAARLVVPATARGPGAARNIGLDFGRGPHCLFLDAGQMLYPRALDVLTGTLSGIADAAFVYPIQEVIGAPNAFVEAGGDYLMSFFGWDPGRLRVGNHIHPPVLIRAECLRQLGGFATIRPSTRGLRPVVPDRGAGVEGPACFPGAARRTESASSYVLAEIHPTTGPGTVALSKRSPRLMGGAFR